jgi:hypothetical protein
VAALASAGVLVAAFVAPALPPCAGEVSAHLLEALSFPRPRAAGARAPRAVVDGVALLEDQGDLVARRNPFDLGGRAIRFEPDGAGYRSRPLEAPVPEAGLPVAVSAGAPAAVALPFAFPFYGSSYRSVWVHEDGHLTLGAADPSPAGVQRLESGPARIAALYTDLDLGRGGRVATRTEAGRLVVAWEDVPSAGRIDRNTVALTLHADGAVDMAFGPTRGLEGFVGVAPGGGARLRFQDLSAPARAEGALLERFSEQESVDLVAVAGRFASQHPGVHDQLVVYTSRPLNPLGGTLAFEVTLRNTTSGIGTPELDAGAEWQAGPGLQSVVFMDTARVYRDVDGFEVLGHEVGHRWLASLRFQPAAGETGRELMSGDGVHWSFFADTDASVLGGNDTAALGGDRFETVDVARRYGPLDQYAMGLRAPAGTEPTVLYATPDDFRPARAYRSSTSPEVGVSFTARPRPVQVSEVAAVMGPRQGPDAETARAWRVAFVLVSEAGSADQAEHLQTVARIRRNFEAWFEAATGGRGRALTGLE